MSEKITKYNLEYEGVLCTGVQWGYGRFYFTKDCKEYEFDQTEDIQCVADTDHIRCVIKEQFLPWIKDEHIKKLQAENAALREQVSKMVMPPCTLGDTLYIVACTFGDGYDDDDEIIHQSGFSVVKRVVTEKNFYRMCDLVRNGKAFFSREAALARLAELKGEKE